MRSVGLKDRLKMASYAAFMKDYFNVQLFPHQVKVIEKLPKIDPKAKAENKEKFRKALRAEFDV
jgi:hypothetical protein